MFAAFHKQPAPGPGMCVIRVFEPLTPRERDLAAAIRTDLPMWRVCVWSEAGVFLTSTASYEQPELLIALRHCAEHPEHWVEIVPAA